MVYCYLYLYLAYMFFLCRR